MKNPVTIGTWDENDLICIITVEKEDVERAFECINEGIDMWYAAAHDDEDDIEYPNDWDKDDWIGVNENGEEINYLYYSIHNEAVSYLLDKRNIEYIFEYDMMEECDPDILGNKVIWG